MMCISVSIKHVVYVTENTNDCNIGLHCAVQDKSCILNSPHASGLWWNNGNGKQKTENGNI